MTLLNSSSLLGEMLFCLSSISLVSLQHTRARWAFIKQDLTQLLDATRIDKQFSPKVFSKLRSVEGKQLCRNIQINLKPMAREHNESEPARLRAFLEMLANSPDSKHLEHRVCALVLENLTSATSVAVAWLNQNQNNFEIATMSGEKSDRLRQPVQIHLDEDLPIELLKEHEKSLISLTAPNAFKNLGVSSSLILPVVKGSSILGIVWLGGTDSLRSEKQTSETLSLAAELLSYGHTLGELHTKNEEEKSLLLGVSHDLRTPVTTALYALRLMKEDLGLEGKKGGTLAELYTIEQCLTEQLDLLADILDYARSERELIRPEKKIVSLEGVLHQVQRSLESLATRKGLSFEILDRVNTSIFVDPLHLKRILINLTSNAIKYTDNGGVHIKVRENANQVEIEISDSGLGIPPQLEAQLFTPFGRLQNAKNISGTGIGLALSKQLAETNGMYLNYKSNQPHGAIFSLIAASIDHQAEQGTAFSANQILILDDNPVHAQAIARAVMRNKSEAKVTHTVEDARNHLNGSKPPCTFISDYYLGQGTAQCTIETAVERGIPTIVLTGAVDAIDQRIASHPLVQIIEKPFSREQLINLLEGQNNIGDY